MGVVYPSSGRHFFLNMQPLKWQDGRLGCELIWTTSAISTTRRANVPRLRMTRTKVERRDVEKENFTTVSPSNDLPVSPSDVPLKGVALVHVLFSGARLVRRLLLGLQSFLFRSQSPRQLRRLLVQSFNEASASSTARARKEQHTNALCVVKRIMVLTNVGHVWDSAGPWRLLLWDPTRSISLRLFP